MNLTAAIVRVSVAITMHLIVQLSRSLIVNSVDGG
jgi:hypothetical protein